MPYDYNAAGTYVKSEPYARNVRDKIGDTFIAVPTTIQENTEATFQANKAAFEAEILADLAPTAVAAEVVTAREGYASLDARLDGIGNKVLLGTSSTSANIANKAVTLANFVLYTGVRIAVKFTNGVNTLTGLGINANGTGAKGIQLRGANLTSTDQAWQAGDTVPFVFDGTYYQMEDNSALSKVVARVPVGSMVQQGVATFLKLASDQALSNGVNAKIALVKQVGDLAVASNEVTLPAGFYYDISYGVGNTTGNSTGAVVAAKVVKSDGTDVGNGVSVTSRGVTVNWGAAENQVGRHFIDLTSGVQTLIKLNTTAVEGNQSLITESTWMVIKQMKKAV